MRRKLVKHGEKTLMVSLPAKWVKAQGLKKGDEIVIAPKNSSLTLSKGELSEVVEKIKIDLKPESKRHARSILGNAYKLGYDEIRIAFEGQNQLQIIKDQLKRMIGFEIVSLSKNSCLLKSVIKSTVEEYESIKKRAWHNIKSAFEVLISDMEEHGYPNEDLIMELYENVLKVTDFCRRLINKHKFMGVRESCLEYGILLKLVYTIPLIRDAYQYLAKHKIKADKQLLTFTKEISDLCDLVYNAYYKLDPNLSMHVVKLRDDLHKKSLVLFKKPDYAPCVSKLMEIEKLCYGATGHIIAKYFLDQYQEK